MGRRARRGGRPARRSSSPRRAAQPFTQAVARELSAHEHLVFACGRYEGIDQRVIEHAATIGTVREISLGDYVLNGGEVAALAITEAVVRLVPGFMGNAESLVEESHEDGLLEYPVYTKPASWRGRDVPDVLLSGDHGRIAAWRREQAVRAHGRAPARPDRGHHRRRRRGPARGARRCRRDPHPPARLLGGRAAGQPGGRDPRPARDARGRTPMAGPVDRHRPPPRGRLVAAARGRVERHGEHAGAWDVGRLMVAPDLQGQGLGRDMLERIEAAAPADVAAYVLFTGAGSVGQHPDVQEGRLPAARAAPASPVPWCSPRSADSRRFRRLPDLADSTLGPVGQTIAPKNTPGGSATITCHRGCATPPANMAGPTDPHQLFRGRPVATVRSTS